MPELLTLTREGPVATLTLSRPELHNAFNARLIAELYNACEEVAREARGEHHALRVLVLQGAGPSFCAGADLNWMRESLAYTEAENLADAGRLDAMLEALNTLPVAVVGRVHGPALGGGVGLAACCDLVVAAEGATFGFTEARLGLLPAVISRFVMPKIGPGHTRALFISARRFSAAHALAIGLAHEVVPTEQLDDAVARVVADLLRCGPQAVITSKALVEAVSTLSPDEARDYAIAAIAAARTGPEGQEGLRAFLEKRAPQWAG